MKQVFILVLSLTLVNCAHKKKKSVYKFLKDSATEVTRHCPIQVDSILKLENMVAIPEATIRYNYTLKIDTVKYDIRAFENSLRTTTINTVKSNPDVAMFKKLFTTFEYNYNDTLGNFLFRIVVKPKDYLKKKGH